MKILALVLSISLVLFGCQYPCCNIENSHHLSYPTTEEVISETNITEIEENPFEVNILTPAIVKEEVKETTTVNVTPTRIETSGEVQGNFGTNEVIGVQAQMHDTIDPVDVGGTTAYILEVWNNGPKEAKNVKIVGIIPPEASFVSAKVDGLDYTVNAIVKNDRVIYDTIENLIPNNKITYEMKIHVEKVADIVGSFEIECSDFPRTVAKQEGTSVIKIK